MKKLIHLMVLATVAFMAFGCSGGSAEDASQTPPKGGEVSPNSPGSAAPSVE